MRILGCFKVVSDYDLVADEDWIPDEQLHIDTGYVKLLWNCYDEGALEMMLKLSDLSEGFGVVYELNALTVGKKKHENFLKILYALGFEHAARAESEEDKVFVPEEIAGMIASYVQKEQNQDVIVMGTGSSDGNNRKTPYLTAEKLGWPCITQVVGMEPVDEAHLKVISETTDGKRIWTVKTPCVLAVGNAPCVYLRVPTLKDKMSRGKRPIEYVTEFPEEKEDSGVELVDLHVVKHNRDAKVIEGETPEEKAATFYENYLKGRKNYEISLCIEWILAELSEVNAGDESV